MQLWLESLFRSRDYLLCVIHFKSSKTQRIIAKDETNTSTLETGVSASNSDPPEESGQTFHSTEELVILAVGQIEIEVTGVIQDQ